MFEETKGKASSKKEVMSEDEDEIVDAEAEEEAESTGAEAIPQEGIIVKKHTINVEKDNEESKNPAGKDTYWKLV